MAAKKKFAPKPVETVEELAVEVVELPPTPPTTYTAIAGDTYPAIAGKFKPADKSKHEYALYLFSKNGGKPLTAGTTIKL